MDKLSIAQWDEADRPREKLERLGPQALSNAELLAILIGSGSADESAVDLMRRVLQDCGGSLRRLGRTPMAALCVYKGIGPAKAVTLMAACELGRRRAAEPAEQRPQMATSRDIYNYFLPLMQDLPTEECHVMLLNQQLRLIGSRCVGRGGLSSTLVDVRCVMYEAITARASALALCHNHPSGATRPSADDDRLTERVAQAARLLDVRLVDHIVLAEGGYFSYADEGRLNTTH